ncbi:hypothetical protein QL285_034057 [Trifolium repens]|jgi:hypothetical protein|nr:hypothetical protein QL285_034057 [Trifolium repens]
MGGGSKRRTKKKSKSKKLTSSEHQRIYDQVLSEIQAKQVAEEEKARQLAEEARAREIQARKDKARRDAVIRYQASLNAAAADALYSFSTEQQCPQGQIITRDLFYQRLVELSKMTYDAASPTHSTWIDMKKLLDASRSQQLNEVTKSTQNLSLEEKAAVQEGVLVAPNCCEGPDSNQAQKNNQTPTWQDPFVCRK